jgi:hypothetical protein
VLADEQGMPAGGKVWLKIHWCFVTASRGQAIRYRGVARRRPDEPTPQQRRAFGQGKSAVATSGARRDLRLRQLPQINPLPAGT